MHPLNQLVVLELEGWAGTRPGLIAFFSGRSGWCVLKLPFAQQMGANWASPGCSSLWLCPVQPLSSTLCWAVGDDTPLRWAGTLVLQIFCFSLTFGLL